MDYRPPTRYRSLSMANGGYDNKSPTLIEGLDVVDEQIIVLSPLNVDHPGQMRSRHGRGERQEVRNGMG